MSGSQIMAAFIGHSKDLRIYSVLRTHGRLLSRNRVSFVSVEPKYYV